MSKLFTRFESLSFEIRVRRRVDRRKVMGKSQRRRLQVPGPFSFKPSSAHVVGVTEPRTSAKRKAK